MYKIHWLSTTNRIKFKHEKCWSLFQSYVPIHSLFHFLLLISYFNNTKIFVIAFIKHALPHLYAMIIVLVVSRKPYLHICSRHFFFPWCLFFSFILISWRLINLQYCSGFCHTLTWINHGFTCVPHPEPPSHLPPHPIPLGHPSALLGIHTKENRTERDTCTPMSITALFIIARTWKQPR